MSFSKLKGLTVDFSNIKIQILVEVDSESSKNSLRIFQTSEPGVVVKAHSLENKFSRDSYTNEVGILRHYNSIGQLIVLQGSVEVTVNNSTFGLLLLEHCEFGDLRTFVKKKPFVTDDDILGIAHDVTKSLNVLHESPNPVIHRDIRMENVFISKDGTTKIFDFTAAKQGPFPSRLTADDVRDAQ
jgi:serine/threonine protein kinase